MEKEIFFQELRKAYDDPEIYFGSGKECNVGRINRFYQS